MKKTMLALFISTLMWTSCIKENATKPLSQKEIKQKVDSIMVTKTQALENYSRKDLIHRMKIEVKGKADSIVNAHMNAAIKDTTKPVNVVKHQ